MPLACNFGKQSSESIVRADSSISAVRTLAARMTCSATDLRLVSAFAIGTLPPWFNARAMAEIFRAPAAIFLVQPLGGYIGLFVFERHHGTSPDATECLFDVAYFNDVCISCHRYRAEKCSKYFTVVARTTIAAETLAN